MRFHRALFNRIVLCGALVAFAAPMAQAQYEPVIAWSGRQGVPVIIEGLDATGAIVLGDWGLARPGAAVAVIGAGPPLIALPPGGYFPATGRRPRRGRDESDVIRRPAPAQNYRRSWVAQSGNVPSHASRTLPGDALEFVPDRWDGVVPPRARWHR